MSRFRRRLMGLAALRQAAADDFVRVEYIENTSTAYINSGIFGTMDLDFYIEFKPTQLYPNSGNGVGTIFGSRTDYKTNAYQLTTFNKNATNKGHFLCAKNYGYSDNRVPTANMFLGGKNIIKKEGLKFTRADGTTFNLTSQSFTTPSTMYIFALESNNGTWEQCKFKLYKLQFSKNGTLVRDFIPMYQISTDTYGLWDRVTEEFYTSPNGVKFTGGERYDTTDIIEVHPKLIANTYINENSGAQQNYGGWSSSDYIDVEGFKYIQVPYPFGKMNYKYGAYYDKDKNRISNTASLTIPSNAKYVRLSTTTGGFTNVWLFKRQFTQSKAYQTNHYIETDGSIVAFNGWNIFNTESVYKYFYCWIYSQSYRYQASYNTDGSVYQSGKGFLERPEGGKVLLSDKNTSITYYAGYNYEYKNMNE